jgi:hypothetical protein
MLQPSTDRIRVTVLFAIFHLTSFACLYPGISIHPLFNAPLPKPIPDPVPAVLPDLITTGQHHLWLLLLLVVVWDATFRARGLVRQLLLCFLSLISFALPRKLLLVRGFNLLGPCLPSHLVGIEWDIMAAGGQPHGYGN